MTLLQRHRAGALPVVLAALVALAALGSARTARAQGIKNDFTSCHGSTAPTYTAGSCGTTGSTSGSGSVYTLDYTVPTIAAGSNKFVLVGLALVDTAATISSVVFDADGGSPVTLDKLIGANSDSNTCRVLIYGKAHAISGSSKKVRVTTTAAKRIMITAQSFSNVLNRDYSVADGSTNSWAKFATGTANPVALTKNTESADYLFNTVCITRTSSSAWFLGTTPPYKPQIPLIDSCIDSSANCYTAEATTTLRYACDDGVGSNGGEYGGSDVACSNPATSSVMKNDYNGASASPHWGTIVVKLEPTYPSAVRLDDFTVWRAGGQAHLRWRTGLEVDSLGFHVYRDQGRGRVRLTSAPIPGSALLTGGGTLGAGQLYSWDDGPLPAGAGSGEARYWLEEIDMHGKATSHGPARVVRPPLTATAAGLGTAAHARSAVPLALAAEAPADGPPAPATTPPRVLALAEQSPAQWLLAASAGVKIGVDHEGWYEIGQAALVAAGLDPVAVDPRRLALSVEGHAVPLRVRGEEDGKLDPGDSVGFYGRGLNASTTDTRVYWLSVAGQAPAPGARVMAAASPAPAPAESTDRFTGIVEARPRTVYFTALLDGPGSNFFGPVIRQTPVTQALRAPHLLLDASSASSPPVLEVGVQGVSQTPHRVNVSVGGVLVGSLELQDRQRRSARWPLPMALPDGGQLEVTLTSVDSDSDVSMLDFVRLEYPRALLADDGALTFVAPGGTTVAVGGFVPSTAIDLFDVTDETLVTSVGDATSDGSGVVRFAVPQAGPRRLIARAADHAESPGFVAPNRPSQWNAAQTGGDLLVIGRADLLPGLDAWKQMRQAQGWTVALVDVEDVYDEFAFGARHPDALRAFIGQARQSWSKPPRAVLLVGDATLDPRNYLGKGAFDLVPTKLIDTAVFETASDDWFTDFDDDGIADIPVGRLPVRTPADLEVVVTKLLAAPVLDSPETAPGAGPLLFVSDKDDEVNDFRAAAAGLQAQGPPGFPVVVVDRNLEGDAVARLGDALKQAPSLVSYVGHGSQDLWSGGLLSTDTLAQQTSAGPAAFWAGLTCLNGFFQDAHRPSLAEALMARPGGGAFGVWASSGFTNLRQQAGLGRAFAHNLTMKAMTVGEAARAAKAETDNLDVRRTWILFGDPTWQMFRKPGPAPVVDDAGAPDAGAEPEPMLVDAGDAAVPDAGLDPAAPASKRPGGCSCDAGAGPRPAGGLLFVVLAAALALVRHQRRRPR